jgi:alginate O-acetyltransferase complex protein AlgI
MGPPLGVLRRKSFAGSPPCHDVRHAMSQEEAVRRQDWAALRFRVVRIDCYTGLGSNSAAMIFLSYWFIAFAVVSLTAYACIQNSLARRFLLLAASMTFYVHYAGKAGIASILLLSAITFVCGWVGGRVASLVGITACVATLVFYKYTIFFAQSFLGLFDPALATLAAESIRQVVPEVPPLGVSFFVFEFVHYLVEVGRGGTPIRSPVSFALFGFFWPSLVAGPIKRYRDFVPQIDRSMPRPDRNDAMIGLLRVATGLLKKFVAGYLTEVIQAWDKHLDVVSVAFRWELLAAIAIRILFDFSGYSDIAIGYARMMGIRIPENFAWPYLATSPTEFWRRWHISLSSWIRDYIYIPLGGGRHGPVRRSTNVAIAFAICGLWHGAGWNFVLWGLYHGAGLVGSTLVERRLEGFSYFQKHAVFRVSGKLLGWAMTLLFVAFGWLLFFYPMDKAWTFLQLLFEV